jgi:hypothetical protein
MLLLQGLIVGNKNALVGSVKGRMRSPAFELFCGFSGAANLISVEQGFQEDVKSTLPRIGRLQDNQRNGQTFYVRFSGQRV